MAANPAILINKSGTVVNVYSLDCSTIIGQLMNREAYSQRGSEGDLVAIQFLGPNGGFLSGVLKNPSGSVLTPCTDYPYGTEVIEGVRYYTFIMRSTREIVTMYGKTWGNVAAGRKVACLSSLAGQERAWTKQIIYCQNTSGGWERVDKDGAKYGFVDTGLRTGSSPASIAMYGSW